MKKALLFNILKPLSLLGLFLICFFNSCKEKEIVIPKIILSGLGDSAIFSPNSLQQYIINTPVKWKMNRIVGGAIDSTGKLTVGKEEGVFVLTAVNAKNPLDSVQRTFFVMQRADFYNEMKKGGYILSFRHASASVGSDQTNSKEPEWWKSCDSKLARQITSAIGYPESDSTGQVLKALKIPLDTTMTSEFCRCKQTAENFKLPVPIKEYKELTFFVYDEANRYENTMKLFAKKPITSKNIIAVGHAGYGKVPNPAPLSALNWGDCAVFKQVAVGTEPTYLFTIPVTEWKKTARALKK